MNVSSFNEMRNTSYTDRCCIAFCKVFSLELKEQIQRLVFLIVNNNVIYIDKKEKYCFFIEVYELYYRRSEFCFI